MILLLELAVEENVHCNCGRNRAEDIRQSISRRIGMKRRAANTSDRQAWACTLQGSNLQPTVPKTIALSS
jgi:hypothetical protein